MFKKARARIEQELRDRLGDEQILALEDGANFFGVEAKGKAQIRGNGVLAATRDEIVFVMWLPRKEIRVRRDRVTAVERTRWHLGKSVGRELLRVRFTNDDGEPDSIAWWSADLTRWETVLRA